MNTNQKIASKRKRNDQSILIEHEFKSTKGLSGKSINRVLIEIFRNIPEVICEPNKVYNGINNIDFKPFDYLLTSLIEVSVLVDYQIEFDDDELNSLTTFNNLENILGKMIVWLTVNDTNILITVIYSVTFVISMLIKLKNKIINVWGKKKTRIENSEFSVITLKYMKVFIQIFSHFSMSANVRVRVACIYCTTILSQLDEFRIQMIEDAFLTPVSLTSCIGFDTEALSLLQGDTMNPELCFKFIPKLHEADSKLPLTQSFSMLCSNVMNTINGSDNDLFDKGWLFKRLDDESPTIRFEIFIMIYKLLKIGKISNSGEFLKLVSELAHDCFLDENVAIQSIVSGLIPTLTKNFPMTKSEINKILCSINDSNIYIRYNILKIISLSYFEDVDSLLHALSTVLDSPLLHSDKRMIFSTFLLTAVRNPLLVTDAIPILFEKYFHKTGEIYHASISIFLFWAIWKTPSIIKHINFNLLLLYPIAKYTFSPYIPDIRIRTSCEAIDSLSFEVEYGHYDHRVINYSLGLYPTILRAKCVNNYLLKKRFFVSVVNDCSNDYLNNTTMEMCKYVKSLTGSVVQISIYYFTSNPYITMSRKGFLALLEMLTSNLKARVTNPRINAIYNISNLKFHMGKDNCFNTHLFTMDDEDTDLEANDEEFDVLDLNVRQHLWPISNKLNNELCNLLNGKVILCSSFIINVSDIRESISYPYFSGNCPIKIKDKFEQSCFLFGNIAKEYITFKSLFCQCIACTFHTYNLESNPKYLDYSSNVIFSEVRDSIIKKDSEKAYIFPYNAEHNIPLSISFSVYSIINDTVPAYQGITLFVQIPRTMLFKSLSTEQTYKSSEFLIEDSHIILDEIEASNFNNYNTANVYLQVNGSSPIEIIHSKESDPISNYISQLDANDRAAHLFPIAKDTLRMSIYHLLNLKFKRPIVTPINMNTLVISGKKSLAWPISNIFPMTIHPTYLT